MKGTLERVTWGFLSPSLKKSKSEVYRDVHFNMPTFPFLPFSLSLSLTLLSSVRGTRITQLKTGRRFEQMLSKKRYMNGH
jgi:hypothetical protein